MSAPKRKQAPKKERRLWCLAHIIVTWRKEIGPLARKAYSAKTDRERVQLATELRRRLLAFVAGLDSVLPRRIPLEDK